MLATFFWSTNPSGGSLQQRTSFSAVIKRKHCRTYGTERSVDLSTIVLWRMRSCSTQTKTTTNEEHSINSLTTARPAGLDAAKHCGLMYNNTRVMPVCRYLYSLEWQMWHVEGTVCLTVCWKNKSLCHLFLNVEFFFLIRVCCRTTEYQDPGCC